MERYRTRNLELQLVSQQIEDWLRSQVEKASAKGGLVGLSGGIDSSVVASLAKRALGKDKVLGLIMPENFSPKQDIDDALNLGERLDIQTKIIPIHSIVEAYGIEDNEQNKMPLANLRARLRMTILYFHANSLNYLVIGTGDRSEHLLGYFTKYGDGGTDLEPIGMLYKTEVRALGMFLGLSEKIVSKPSSPQLYPGHLASQELPADYSKLDTILADFPTLVDHNPLSRRLLEMNLRSEHKRNIPPSPW